ncbi:hypothetical protein [Chitinophaga solisilvae]|uniref:hypothetical protein n=1 Tax=Chitinophaga solisilvae TaxID=1233460 RepID=UPI00136CF365|nr:hypothetical protein [Chitinophaga solisilvae]
MKNMIPCLIALLVLTCCQERPLQIPAPLLRAFHDSMTLASAGKHYGMSIISDGVLISQVFDKSSRGGSHIRVHNTREKKYYGEYRWPKKDGVFYFGIDQDSSWLYYYTQPPYLVRVHFHTRQEDTLQLTDNSDHFIPLLVHHGIACSLLSHDGISMVHTNGNGQVKSWRHEEANVSHLHNTLSLPVSRTENLVASQRKEGVEWLYCIDSNLQMRWRKAIDVRPYNNRIAMLHMHHRYVIMYDSTMVVTDRDGNTLWQTKFGNYVSDVLMADSTHVLLLFPGTPPQLGGTTSPDHKIIMRYDVANGCIDFQVGIRASGEHYFMTGNRFFLFMDDSRGMAMDAGTGRYELFVMPDGFFEKTDILTDKKTSQYYLLVNGKIYW